VPHKHFLTLTQFLIEERRRFPDASGSLNALLLDVASACKRIGTKVALGKLDISAGGAGEVNVQGEVQKPLDVVSNEIFIETTEWNGNLAALASEEMEQPYSIPEKYSRGPYLLVFDPLDGSSNIDVNVSVGSIFSILHAPEGNRHITESDFLQPGSQQVAAGYALYGPSTLLVLTVGSGVHGFTLDHVSGDFFLTHESISVPEEADEFAINASNSRFWEAPISRYVDECLAGKTGPREKDFNMRWIASMVAEAHRILMRGGVFMYPRDRKDPTREGRLRLLYECNPVGMLIEQANGRISTGNHPLLDVMPRELHQRIGVVFGSRDEVERIERYHAEPTRSAEYSPLFKQRGLFRDSI